MYHAAQQRWDFLGHHSLDAEVKSTPSNIPLGMIDVSEYEQFDVELEPGDCVVSYTDALIESRDADGKDLGEAGVLRIMRHLGDVEPRRLIEALLKEIGERNPENLTDDDVTVLVVRVNGRPPHHPFRREVGRGDAADPLHDCRDQSQGRASAVAGRESREYRGRHYPRARQALARPRIVQEVLSVLGSCRPHPEIFQCPPLDFSGRTLG